jgi:hypothetical protein
MYTHSTFMYMLGIAWETTRASGLETHIVACVNALIMLS